MDPKVDLLLELSEAVGEQRLLISKLTERVLVLEGLEVQRQAAQQAIQKEAAAALASGDVLGFAKKLLFGKPNGEARIES
jgi:hypothetical protein